MRIVYPYNEILPKKRAHDVFVFDECAAMAKIGMDVTLLCGKGSWKDKELFKHYHVQNNTFKIERLPIIRKNNPLNLSWNYPFFFFSQRALRRLIPDWVFLSVRKQGAYHLFHKIPELRYLYEIHELAYYPHMDFYSHEFHRERMMLKRADMIIVTTDALKQILLNPPYALTVPVKVVPLAVKTQRLPPPPENASPLILMYIGQLYAGQGVARLIKALALLDGVKLKIVGGKGDEILHLEKLATEHGVRDAVEFLGFVPPAKLWEIAQESHAFIAPFDTSGRMPYVAHTKLFEYSQWGRPIIAPEITTVKEHFSNGNGALLYEPENTSALAGQIRLLKEKKFRDRLQNEINLYSGKYSWETRAKNYQALISNS